MEVIRRPLLSLPSPTEANWANSKWIKRVTGSGALLPTMMRRRSQKTASTFRHYAQRPQPDSCRDWVKGAKKPKGDNPFGCTCACGVHVRRMKVFIESHLELRGRKEWAHEIGPLGLGWPKSKIIEEFDILASTVRHCQSSCGTSKTYRMGSRRLSHAGESAPMIRR